MDKSLVKKEQVIRDTHLNTETIPLKHFKYYILAIVNAVNNISLLNDKKK